MVQMALRRLLSCIQVCRSLDRNIVLAIYLRNPEGSAFAAWRLEERTLVHMYQFLELCLHD